jgi:hypothetical protein
MPTAARLFVPSAIDNTCTLLSAQMLVLLLFFLPSETMALPPARPIPARNGIVDNTHSANLILVFPLLLISLQ